MIAAHRSLVVAAVVVAVVAVAARTASSAAAKKYSLDDDKDWADFKQRYKKNYDSDVEENYKRTAFHENQRKIEEHNKKYDMGSISYKVKMTQFGDMTSKDYDDYMHPLTEMITPKSKLNGKKFVAPKNRRSIPESIDWRQLGAVTPVHDLGFPCGACWAFAAAGALEGQYFRKTGELETLSTQYLLDCTTKYGNNGCFGGAAAVSFQFVVDHRAMVSEANYPYEGRPQKCQYNLSVKKSKKLRTSFAVIDGADEANLKVAVATVGPISAGLDGSHDTFRFYSEGIYYQPECNEEEINHAILIVGYGTDNHTGKDYWLVKNAWGETWGEAGFMKVPRNQHNHCGIATAGIYPIF